MCTSQEEADTILIDVASHNKNATIHILATYTGVLILALAYFPTLGANPCMLIGHGNSRELIVLKPIYDVLGCPIVSALLGFHCFTGCDTVGRFSGKGKPAGNHSKTLKADKTTVQGFIDLGHQTCHLK